MLISVFAIDRGGCLAGPFRQQALQHIRLFLGA
jgi:hypothetical protein